MLAIVGESYPNRIFRTDGDKIVTTVTSIHSSMVGNFPFVLVDLVLTL